MSESSPLLQLFDALSRCVDPEHHTSLISEALQTAGLAEIPADRPSFRAFINGPLQQTAQQRFGDHTATELTWTLMRMTSVRAPSSSRAPHSSRPKARPDTLEYSDSRPPVQSGRGGDTIQYTDDVFAPRHDVLVVDPDETLFDELSVHLEAREYRVARVPSLDASHGMTRDDAPRLVLMNIELDEALRVATQLERDLGRDGTKVLLLSDDAGIHEAKGVVRIMPRAPLAPVVEAVIEIIGQVAGVRA